MKSRTTLQAEKLKKNFDASLVDMMRTHVQQHVTMRVAQMLYDNRVSGLTNSDMCARLGVSPKMGSYYRYSLKNKYGYKLKTKRSGSEYRFFLLDITLDCSKAYLASQQKARERSKKLAAEKRKELIENQSPFDKLINSIFC